MSRTLTLKKYQDQLLQLKQQTLHLGKTPVKAEYAKLPSEVLDEDIQPLSEMNQVINSNRNQNRAASLAKIEEALARLKNNPNDFGICRECGEEIAVKRLELMPYIDLCAPCQQEKDRANKPGRRKHITDYK